MISFSNSAISQFIAECGRWIEYEAVIDQHNVPINVGIALQNNSLSKAFLYFKKSGVFSACFPINCFLKCATDETKVTFNFFSYNDACIDILIKEKSQCEIISSQITVCTHISKLGAEIFPNENKQFLEKFSQRQGKITGDSIKLPRFPLTAGSEARSTWISRTNFQNFSYYSSLVGIPILVYTWNIAQHPPEEDTFNDIKHIFSAPVDFIAFVLQEIDFSAKAVIIGNSQQRQNWNETIDKASEGKNFETLLEDSLGGVFVRYMVKKDTKFKINVTSNVSVRLGLKGITANKSAIITRFNISGVTFAFIGCHLTPHNPNYEQRNAQMIELLENLEQNGGEPDYTIIFGDLNYRIDIPYEETVELCQKNEIDTLLSGDQLLKFMSEEPRYKDFHEEKITFLPTYKFDNHSNIYDTSKKHRIPSWTDRILFKVGKKRLPVGPSDRITLETDVIRHINLPYQFTGQSYFSIDDPTLNYPRAPHYGHYKSYPDIKFSDHRPVEVLVTFPIPRIDSNKLKEFQTIQNKRLDEFTLLSTPRCKVEPNSFETTGETQITLTNLSCLVAQWKVDLVPQNVTIEPSEGAIQPSQSVTLTVKSNPLPAEIEFVNIVLEGGNPVTFEFWGKKEDQP